MLNRNILLASQSPRRRDILQLANLSFRVVPPDIDESNTGNLPPELLPQHLATKKAHAVTQFARQNEIILAADTVVIKNGILYGKPVDRADAIRMLQELSGNEHAVITGVCLKSDAREKAFSVTTRVLFRQLHPSQIAFYVDHYHPYDKAGAYAIQEWIGVVGIKKIAGCYFNVMGLPMSRIWEELEHW
ncbi:MAG: Maf-like protein [Chitinophagales bacterium]|nr:MAG: Maf-like protein [Chitinophagales bacterium]